MSLGQEFGAFATTVAEDVERLKAVSGLFHEINMGATAIGTGINAPPGYAPVVADHLKKLTGLPMQTSVDLIEATWDTGAYLQLSGILRRIAVKLSKICNDLRLLSSGPRAGLNRHRQPLKGLFMTALLIQLKGLSDHIFGLIPFVIGVKIFS